ncbi:MAG: hypothetical protein M1830_006443 [Pleopsidium flavum]|nr:MAG: hypothetical protein M1830_006443 [Pleopsidium flavum]
MSRLLVVFGATGQQGGSVANYVVSDPELSKQYKVRGLTRDPSKPAAQTLQQKGVEVVKGDLDDEESVKQALQGAHTVYAMTRTIYDDQAKSREQARNTSSTALSHTPATSRTASTPSMHTTQRPMSSSISVACRIKSAFVAPGTFTQNFAGMMAPRPAGDGTYAIANIHTGEAKFPWLDVVSDSGKFVGAILAEPEKYESRVLSASSCIYSLDEIVQIMSKVTGKTVKYSVMPESKYRGFLPPVAADSIVNMFLYIQDCGYYGPKTKEEVEWSVQHARGKLTSFEDYLLKNPLKLE